MAFRVLSEDALPPNVVAALRAQGVLPDAAAPAPPPTLTDAPWRLRDGGTLVDAATGKVYAVTEVAPPKRDDPWSMWNLFKFGLGLGVIYCAGAIVWQVVFGA